MDGRSRTLILQIIELRISQARRQIEALIEAAYPSNFANSDIVTSERIPKILDGFRAAYLDAQSRLVADVIGQSKSAKALLLLTAALEDFRSAFADRLPFFVCFPYSQPRSERDARLLKQARSDLRLLFGELDVELRIASSGFAVESESPRKPTAARSELGKFVRALIDSSPEFISETEMLRLARIKFADAHVSRDMVREFTKGRRRGRPKARG